MKTILIVDDEYDIVSTLQMILSFEGYTVGIAFHGAEALNKLEESPLPDLIISDVTMPVLDGYAFVKALKKTPNHAAIPIILMSAAQLDNTRIEEGSYTLFIRKPFDVDRLLNDVKKILTNKHGKI